MKKLGELKCDTADSPPFEAQQNITYTALDTTFAAIFGHSVAEGAAA